MLRSLRPLLAALALTAAAGAGGCRGWSDDFGNAVTAAFNAPEVQTQWAVILLAQGAERPADVWVVIPTSTTDPVCVTAFLVQSSDGSLKMNRVAIRSTSADESWSYADILRDSDFPSVTSPPEALLATIQSSGRNADALVLTEFIRFPTLEERAADPDVAARVIPELEPLRDRVVDSLPAADWTVGPDRFVAYRTAAYPIVSE